MKLINRTLTLSIAALSTLSGAYALTDAESASVLFMKQEEKLAHDVYTYFSQIYDLPVFSNIAASETRHMEAVDYLIQSNSLQDSTPLDPGVFTYPELNNLYSQLTTKGEASLLEALEAGVIIEETDISDLEAEIDFATDATLLTIYKNLLRASQKHLATFQSLIACGGVQLDCPNLQVNANANGSLLLNANAGNRNGNNRRGINLAIQEKTAGAHGPWTNVGGNANGAGMKAGNSSAPIQIALNQPADATLYRARLNAGMQATYSNTICSQLVNTPWPQGEFLGQGWFATWMGELFIKNYPLVYCERFGWIAIESFFDENLWFIDENGKKWMTREDRYPWIYDPDRKEWI